jgi:lysylphosphatidylglycerol synthetase-like protein (DUF2156 family)/UDP-2,3-diacylglucosamine pyrophosphatase LpxH
MTDPSATATGPRGPVAPVNPLYAGAGDRGLAPGAESQRHAPHLEEVVDQVDVVVPRGGRAVVVSDIHLTGTVTSASAGACSAMIEVLTSWTEPGAFVIAGDGFEQLHDPVAPIEAILDAHGEWAAAVKAFAAEDHHQVVVLSGNHDGNIAWDPHVVAVLTERLGVTHFGLTADLVLQTGQGDERVHVVHGNQDDPYNAFTDPRSSIDTPTGHHVVRQVLPQLDRTVKAGGLLDGLTWLSEPMQAGEMVGSRLLYRRLIGHSYWLAIPFLAALVLRLVAFLPGVETLLDNHAVGWLIGLGAGMLVLTVLIALVAVMTMLGVHRALATTELGDRTGVGAHNAATRERAARLVELGYAGLVSGHTHSPELSVVGDGFYANSGCGVEVLGPMPARLGLPRPFVSVRRSSRVELRAGEQVEVDLVLADAPLPVAYALERLVMKPDTDTPVTPTVVASLPGGSTWPIDATRLGTFAHTRRARRRAAGLLLFVAAVNLVSSLLGSLFDRFDIIDVVFVGRFPRSAGVLTVVIAVALVGLARGVRRGYHAAWVAATLLLGLTAVAMLVRGLDIEEGLLNLAVAIWLVVDRHYFRVSFVGERRWRTRAVVLVIAAIGLTAMVYAVFGSTHDVDGMRVAFGVALVALLGFLLRRPSRPDVGANEIDPTTYDRALDIVERFGGDTLDYVALRDDKSRLFSGEGLISYTVAESTMVIAPDPICPPDERAAVWASALDHANTHDWDIAVLGAVPSWLPIYHAAGLHDVYIGDEAILDCERFDLDAPAHDDLRAVRDELVASGFRATVLRSDDVPAAMRDQLVALADPITRRSAHHRATTNVGRVLDARDRDNLVAVCTREGSPDLVAMVHFVPAPTIGGYSLDLANRVTDASVPDAIIQLLLTETIAWLQANGHTGLGLNVVAPAEAASAERLIGPRYPGHRMFARFEPSKTLLTREQIDAYYDPSWRPRYIVTDTLRAGRPVAPEPAGG